MAAGDLMMKLIDATSQARLTQVETDIAAHTASIDRLVANMESADVVVFPGLAALSFSDVNFDAVMTMGLGPQ